jgi:hypothetical protein
MRQFLEAAGFYSGDIDYGPILPLTCPRCKKQDYWRLIEKRSEYSLLSVTLSSNSKYLLVCPACYWMTFLTEEQAHRAKHLRQVTAAFFEKKISDEEYRRELEAMRYLH